MRWKTVVFHHSVYSTASHVDDGDIIERREELPPMFSELDIDVVLMGHDHVYTRTYMMNGTTPDDSQGVQSEVTNPEGVLYLTANSASGSKYYDIKAPEAAYSAVMDQSYRRTITDIDVTDTSYTMTTYYMDTMEVLDTFTINKIDTDKSELEGLVEKAEQVSEADCTAEEWQALQSALEAAKSVLADEKATQDAVNEAYTALQSAYDAATTQDPADPGEDNGQG
ncbi:MAG: phosphohydrolase, partial [Merdibacter sp.]